MHVTCMNMYCDLQNPLDCLLALTYIATAKILAGGTQYYNTHSMCRCCYVGL